MPENKTEKATPRKRQKAREKGQVAKSREIPCVMTLITGITVLYFYGSHMYQRFRGFSQYLFVNPSMEQLHLLPHLVLKEFAFMITPIMAGVLIVAIMANISQVGFLFSVEAISFDLTKIDPISGIKRLFSKQMVVEVFKSIAKIAIVGVVVFSIIKGEISNLITLMDREVGAIFQYLMVVSFKIIIYVAPIMVILAVIDYAFQKWEFERNLKMTREEVKEEFRQTEGDPLVKARIRSLQRQMAKQRMMKDVPKADVIIKNPTHLAVALRYVKEEMHAPKVIAKGAGIIAEKIEEIAKSHGIPVIQNKKLAQALYKMVEIGEEIPAVLYQAVAEVLAYIYRLRGEMNE